MALFALSDLHLSLSSDKPMDVFGSPWQNHTERIRDNWNKTVKDNDLVIIGGDVSWATYLSGVSRDFEFINSLPGKKLIIKGNHDYWWESITKLEKFVLENGFESISFLHNSSFTYENFSIAGTRFWLTPDTDNFTEEDKKIYDRELIRLSLSLESLSKKELEFPDRIFKRIAVLHFPPVNSQGKCDERVMEILKKHLVEKCIYGHLHSGGIKTGFTGSIDGIDFYLTSADALEFIPIQIK
ncbi:MAG: metallophosphoesterase [Clostridia bacterium]|nr:metallophosphoesterase [Clostridia bacterium]